MILKKVILSGFKSFPDKTEFDFDAGITCIVGPNGCGKSNVVDAVKWVLGEQSAKSLRGDQMMDMIFNGSSSRKSSGCAQVDLIFDNSDRTLAVEQLEVAVSRRLFRSGESEYLLNLQPCRLKDVRELFLDTGVGVDAYSVIEQGRVDILLKSNPQERRLIFEEAAGVSKYKVRRREAERKLERTQQNLLRAQDIIDELDRRLRGVRIQAGRARKFQEYDQRYRELRASFALAEFHRLNQTHQRLQQEQTALSDHCIAINSRFAQQDADIARLETELLHLDQTIEQHQQQASQLQAQITTLQERIRQNEHRQFEQKEMLETYRQQAAQELERLQKLEASLQVEQEKLPTLETESRQQAEQAQALLAEDQLLSRQIVQLQATLEDEKSGIIDLLRDSAEQKNRLTELDLTQNTLRQKISQLVDRDSQISVQLEELLHRKAVAQDHLQQVDELTGREQHRLEEKLQELDRLKRQRHVVGDELMTMKAERSGLRSEQQLLQDLENKMEGVDQAVRDLLHRRTAEPDNHRLQSIIGMVADIFSTDLEHAQLIESALEYWAQHLVIADSERFLALNGELGTLKGRLHLICLDRLGPVMNGPSYSGATGFVARALDLVKYPEPLEYLAKYLLGRTIIVDSLATALQLSTQDTQNHQFITRDGTIVDSRGQITLGPKSARTGLISRKSRLRDVNRQLRQLDQQINEHQDQAQQLTTAAEHLEQLIHELRNAIYQNHTVRAQSQAELQHAQEAIQRLTREQPLITGEVQLLEGQITAAVEETRRHRESLEALQQRNVDRETVITSYRLQLDQLAQERQALSERLTTARVEAGKLAEKKSATLNNIHALQQSLDNTRQNSQQQVEQIVQCQQRLQQAADAIMATRQELVRLEGELAAHEQQDTAWRRQREEQRFVREQLAEQSKCLRQELHQQEELIHQLQMKLQEASLRQDELCLRVREELQIELESAYQSFQEQEQDWSAVETEIQELRDKISKLGHINLEAIAEQDELEQRLTFLNTQRQDLEDSRRQLEELITRLNDESRERFAAIFQQVRDHFQQMFRKLFGGGKADLVLDPTCPDILEAGIEILAKPPGKELQAISLMSGGEKTMTAIALLMSIFRAKPSPFVFLDEVDAALDEANNERFNAIVREFLDQSQFIIITHSKRTMQVAGTLYGITMQEPGVSRRVSVRFEQNRDEVASAVA
ncbi:MAG: Chromosome partition protein Smc [Phycisphaerae bacterium]|nr:Chromosome partition protein Smc [Phycisphaerae bacterium]